VSNSRERQTTEFRLVHVSLDDHPQYEALSYTWDSKKKKSRILLNGYVFRVTENLEQALSTLVGFRKLWRRISYLWVDAICINQDSDQERNHQVGKIRIIYERARQVCVWLGGKANDSDLAFGVLYKLKKVIYIDLLVKIILGNPDHKRHLRALEVLFSRRYWFRVWVVQEIASAREITVHCGNDVISWTALRNIQDRHEDGFLLHSKIGALNSCNCQ